MDWKEFLKPSRKKLMHSSIPLVLLALYFISAFLANYIYPFAFVEVALHFMFTALLVPILPILILMAVFSGGFGGLEWMMGCFFILCRFTTIGMIFIAVMNSLVFYFYWSSIEYRKSKK